MRSGKAGIAQAGSAPMTHSVRGFCWGDDWKAASRPGVPVPIPTRVERRGTGTGKGSVDQGGNGPFCCAESSLRGPTDSSSFFQVSTRMAALQGPSGNRRSSFGRGRRWDARKWQYEPYCHSEIRRLIALRFPGSIPHLYRHVRGRDRSCSNRGLLTPGLLRHPISGSARPNSIWGYLVGLASLGSSTAPSGAAGAPVCQGWLPQRS